MTFLLTACSGRCYEIPGSCKANCSKPCDGFVNKGGVPEEWEPDEHIGPELFGGMEGRSPSQHSHYQSRRKDYLDCPGLPDLQLQPPYAYTMSDRTLERERQRSREGFSVSSTIAHALAKDLQNGNVDAALVVDLQSKMDELDEAERAVIDPRTGLPDLDGCPLLEIEKAQLACEEHELPSHASKSSTLPLLQKPRRPVAMPNDNQPGPRSLSTVSEASAPTTSLPSVVASATTSEASYRFSDPDGDAGMFTGTVNSKGEAHGKGSLRYDHGVVFAGSFVNGAMDEGVVYDVAGKPKFTMKSGQWTAELDRSICENPLNARPPDGGSLQDFVVGQRVEVQASGSDEWLKGEVTCIAPLFVRPDGCNISSSFPRIRSLVESTDVTDASPVEGDVRKSLSDKFASLRDRLALFSDASAPEECDNAFCFFGKFTMGPFLDLRMPNGQTWGDYCGAAEPNFAGQNVKVLSGAWAECMQAAVVYESSHPKFKDDPDYSDSSPTEQVADYFEACGHSDYSRALEEIKLVMRRHLASSGASGISSSRCSSRCSSPGPSSSRQSRDLSFPQTSSRAWSTLSRGSA